VKHCGTVWEQSGGGWHESNAALPCIHNEYKASNRQWYRSAAAAERRQRAPRGSIVRSPSSPPARSPGTCFAVPFTACLAGRIATRLTWEYHLADFAVSDAFDYAVVSRLTRVYNRVVNMHIYSFHLHTSFPNRPTRYNYSRRPESRE